MRLLLIEDEPKTIAYLKKGLTESGFVVDVADNGEEGLFLHRISVRFNYPRCDAAQNGWMVCDDSSAP